MTAFGKAISSEKEPIAQETLFGKQLLKEVPIIKCLQKNNIDGLSQLKSNLAKFLTKKRAAEVERILVS